MGSHLITQMHVILMNSFHIRWPVTTAACIAFILLHLLYVPKILIVYLSLSLLNVMFVRTPSKTRWFISKGFIFMNKRIIIIILLYIIMQGYTTGNVNS